MEEGKLINNIKNNIDIDSSLNALYILHSRIYYKIIHQYFSKDDYLDKKNELIAECKYHIYFAAKEFDYSKNTKFSSYLGNKARWLCLGFFNFQKKLSKFDEKEPEKTEL